MVNMINWVYPTVDEKGNPIFECQMFDVGILRKPLEHPRFKHYHPEPSKDDIVKFLDEILYDSEM